MKNILIVDSEISMCNLLSEFLRKNNYKVETVREGHQAIELSKNFNFDLILSEYYLPDTTGSKLFDEIRKMSPDIHMILMGEDVHVKSAVEMIRRGVTHFLSKPLNPGELIEIIEETGKTQLKGGTKCVNLGGDPSHPSVPFTDTLVIGQSSVSRAVTEQVRRVAPTNFSVVIQGETGTGKESFARMIHLNSHRKNGPFIAVDCGCLSRELAGSELFGHQKGSFTGAVTQKSGLFEQANGGTLFLDEIANLPVEVQVGLLRVLQEKVIRKIGGIKEIPLDVRIIVASNENLKDKIETADFREDLYYRLCEFTLEIPPMRDRMEDLPLFVDFFLKETCRELGKPKPAVSPEVQLLFQKYNWPGNLRELRNTIRRACLFVDQENEIRKEFLPGHIQMYNPQPDPQPHLYVKTNLESVRPKYDLKSTALMAEYHRIVEVLEKVRYNKTKAAEILKIHRKTLYVKLKLLNIPY